MLFKKTKNFAGNELARATAVLQWNVFRHNYETLFPTRLRCNVCANTTIRLKRPDGCQTYVLLFRQITLFVAMFIFRSKANSILSGDKSTQQMSTNNAAAKYEIRGSATTHQLRKLWLNIWITIIMNWLSTIT